MRQTVVLVTILILGISLATGLLVGNLAGGGSDDESTLVTRSPATSIATVPVRTPIASPAPAAGGAGTVTTRLNPWS